MTELKNRSVNDILIAVVDGLKGFPEAIQAVFPRTQIQTCIVHLIRASLDYASWKDRKSVATELKTIYRAPDAEAARDALDAFDQGPWGRKYPPIAASWRRHWEEVIPFFAYPADVRKNYLHHQRHRIAAHASAQDHQNARSLPERRGRHQADLPRLEKHHEGVEDERTGMEVGDDAVRDPVPRAVRAAALSVTMFNRLAHRITDRSRRTDRRILKEVEAGARNDCRNVFANPWRFLCNATIPGRPTL
jgi:hypothetical protein